jgi:bifunctional non-homologous end joining protein LigD
VPVTFVVFDVLRGDGVDITGRPYSERRARLESLDLDGAGWTTSETFDDGRGRRRMERLRQELAGRV